MFQAPCRHTCPSQLLVFGLKNRLCFLTPPQSAAPKTVVEPKAIEVSTSFVSSGARQDERTYPDKKFVSFSSAISLCLRSTHTCCGPLPSVSTNPLLESRWHCLAS